MTTQTTSSTSTVRRKHFAVTFTHVGPTGRRGRPLQLSYLPSADDARWHPDAWTAIDCYLVDAIESDTRLVSVSQASHTLECK